MAKCIQFAVYGGLEVLEYYDCQPAEPGPREVHVRNHATGLNLIDAYYRSGPYPTPGFPLGPGSGGAGEAEVVGSKMTRFRIGDRVVYATGPLGAYSELYMLAEEKLVHLPDDIDFEQAVAVMFKGLITQYLLHQTYEPRGGETVLFHATAGGVGLFAYQWTKVLGVQLIGTVSPLEKACLARQHGAWETIGYSHESVARRVLELTDGKKCSVVYDSVDKDTWETLLDCVTPRGLLVSFDNTSGSVTGVNLGISSQKDSLCMTRPTLDGYADTPEKLQVTADELFGLIECGDICIEINQYFALAEAVEAYIELTVRRTMDLTVLLP